jgi:hypothetical protein
VGLEEKLSPPRTWAARPELKPGSIDPATAKHEEDTMNRIRRIAAALATVAGPVLVLAAASLALARPWQSPAIPAAPARAPARIYSIVIAGMPVPASPSAPARAPAQVHTIVSGGTPGWQITLAAAGAALVAAAVAVLLARARIARKAHPTTT